MEHIIEQEPELIAEEGYLITNGGEGNMWEKIRLFDWSSRTKYFAIPEPEPEQ
jgi:hypothetical protein